MFQQHKQNYPTTTDTYFKTWNNPQTNYQPTGAIPRFELLPSGGGDTYRLDAVFSRTALKKYTIKHYLENLEGDQTYQFDREFMFYQSSSIRYIFGEYQGFTIYQYRLNTTPESGNSAWRRAYPGSAIDFYANTPNAEVRFSRNSYNLSYYSNGSVISTKKLLYQTAIPLDVPVDTPEGYTFGGWYKDSNYIEKFTDAETVPTNDIVLYAKWIPATYHATVVYNNGASNQMTLVERGGKLTVPEEPVYEGYKFNGWYKENGIPYEFDSPVY